MQPLQTGLVVKSSGSSRQAVFRAGHRQRHTGSASEFNQPTHHAMLYIHTSALVLSACAVLLGGCKKSRLSDTGSSVGQRVSGWARERERKGRTKACMAEKFVLSWRCCISLQADSERGDLLLLSLSLQERKRERDRRKK